MYVLAPLVGSGTDIDPWRIDNVVPGFGILDLRPPSRQTASGWALALLRDGAPVPTGSVTLGALLTTAPNRSTTRSVESNLGLTRDVLAGLTVQRIIQDLAVVHADDARSDRWNTVKAMRDNILRVYCGGLVSQIPVPAGGARIADDFNRPNSTDVGPTWIEERGDFDIRSNQLRATATGTSGAFLKSTSDLASDDVWAEVDRIATEFAGVQARMEAAAGWARGYYGRYRAGTVNRWQLYSITQSTSGGTLTFTLLGELAETLTDPITMRVRCDGSTISLRQNVGGTITTKVTVTDTTYPGGTGFRRVGIAGGTATWDNFAAEDLVATTVVASSTSAVWNARAPANATRTAVWTVVAPVAATRRFVWNVATSIAVARVALWSAAALTAASWAGVWNTAAALAASRVVLWDVESIGIVVSSRVVVWDVQALSARSANGVWNVTTPIATVRAIVWLVAATVVQQRVVLWDVTARVDTHRHFIWDAQTPVTLSIVGLWHTATSIAEARVITWQSSASASQQMIVHWEVLITIELPRIVRWDVAGQVGSVLALRWDIAIQLQVLRPVADITVTGWTTQTGGTVDLWAAVDDYPADDADYAVSTV